MQKWDWKQAVGSVVTVLLLTLLMLWVFHKQWDNILASLAAVSVGSMLFFVFLGILTNVLDALAHWAMVRTSLDSFSFGQAVELVYLGLFFNVATLAAGTVPLQGHYLHQHGMVTGAGMGTVLVEYTLHKAMVLLYAGIMLLFGGQWSDLRDTHYTGYLLAGYGIAILIILFLIVVCCDHRVQAALSKLIDHIPENGNWAKRKAAWQFHLSALGEQSRRIVKDRRACLLSVLFTALKLFTLYSIPFACLHSLGADILRYGQAHLLSALMLLLTGAMPNIGGMGPTEASFLLIFSPFVGQTNALSALILYRIATYYIPFLLGTMAFLHWRKTIRTGQKSRERK